LDRVVDLDSEITVFLEFVVDGAAAWRVHLPGRILQPALASTRFASSAMRFQVSLHIDSPGHGGQR